MPLWKSVNKSRIELSAFVSHVLSVTYDNASGKLKMYGLHQCWALSISNPYYACVYRRWNESEVD
jgi:hypothetical protein